MAFGLAPAAHTVLNVLSLPCCGSPEMCMSSAYPLPESDATTAEYSLSMPAETFDARHGFPFALS